MRSAPAAHILEHRLEADQVVAVELLGEVAADPVAVDEPRGLEEVGRRCAEAARRYGMEFFLEDATAD